jgi:hypothetical protein
MFEQILAKAKELHVRLADPQFYKTIALHKTPDIQEVRNDLSEGYFYIWEVVPDRSETAVGYAGIVGYSGPPFIFFHFSPFLILILTPFNNRVYLIMAFSR